MSSEALYVALYLCVAFFVMGVIGGLSNDYNFITFLSGMLWPVTIPIILCALIIVGLIYLGKNIGEWIGDRL